MSVQPRYEKIHGEVGGEKADIDRNENHRCHKIRPDQRRGIRGVTIFRRNPQRRFIRH